MPTSKESEQRKIYSKITQYKSWEKQNTSSPLPKLGLVVVLPQPATNDKNISTLSTLCSEQIQNLAPYQPLEKKIIPDETNTAIINICFLFFLFF